MNELKEVIETGIENGDQRTFLDLSSKWANYTLRTHKDKLLDKGLAISKALAEFHCELVSPE